MTTTSVAAPGRSVSQMTADLLEADDPTALNIWWHGHRAGVSAERARIQLAAADFGADLGPSPALHPRLRAVVDQGSPEAGKAVRDAAVTAWWQLYASGAIVSEVAA
ncbi:hypothetical protein JRG18_11420 [Kocuria palustris]|uniref:hypothetical protein n=1 Tax=Kocuria palustris TaxID=71999 RepID=UPI00045E6A24|nr:hypothetical protein [Kocuria palustris]MBN6753504.1 hypothetical protein [Kocuria palustris]MBN6759071.1 hypothetical protein [Kocuria palustris]MBN6763584.1 hypothetical protein [Kocuria palustris]MBN6783009.1 hypothetical protein [Kocuria palustris]MBN6799527.1 hypothetical protein [Kocuria palustris]